MKKITAVPKDFCVTCKSFICCGCTGVPTACACPPWKGRYDDLDDEDGELPHYQAAELRVIFHALTIPSTALEGAL